MAGNRSLGTLTLDLIARIGGFTGPLDQAGRVADKRMREIERRAKQFGITLGVAITAAATAIAVGVKNAIDQADALNDLNVRLGISAEKLSGWAYAAKQSGTDIDGLGIGLKKLAKNMADALDSKSAQGKLFAALDLKPIDEATGRLKTLEQFLPEVADKFKTLHDDTLEAALAQQLFGKSGADLLEFLNLGSDGLDSMQDKLRSLGGELSQGTLTAADAFNDKLSDLKTATDGLYTALASDLLPQLTELVDAVIDAAKDGSELREVMHGLAVVFQYMGDVCKDVDNLWRGLVSTGIALYNVAENLQKLNPSTALQSWLAGGDTWAQNWKQAKEAAQQAGEAFSKYGKDYQHGSSGPSVDPRIQPFNSTIPDSALGKSAAEISLEKRLQAMLANPGGGATKSGGKSEAEREMEQLEEAVKRMNDQMGEQIALYGQTTEVAKLRYELEHGELSKALPAEKAELMQKAAILDQLKEEADETERMNKLEEERRQTIDDAHKALASTFSDLQFELDLMGKSNAERQAEIELRRIGAGLTDQERENAKGQLVAMENQLEETRKHIDAMDELRDASTNAFKSVIDGSASGIDALKNFGAAFADMLQRMASEWLTSQLFGQQGTTGGGLFGNILNGLFGGSGGGGSGWMGYNWGAAAGGSSDFGSFADMGLSLNGYASGTDSAPGGWSIVGEHGPELMNVPRGARIVPNHEMASVGGDFTQVNHFNLPRRYDNRTEMQISQATARSGRIASRRNGT